MLAVARATAALCAWIGAPWAAPSGTPDCLSPSELAMLDLPDATTPAPASAEGSGSGRVALGARPPARPPDPAQGGAAQAHGTTLALRAPELAPNQELRDEITEPLAQIKEFVKKIHSGAIKPPNRSKFTYLPTLRQTVQKYA